MRGRRFIIRLHTDEIGWENEKDISLNHNHGLREMCFLILLLFIVAF